MALKQRRECEAKIHEQLYTNIYLLTLSYSTTEKFNSLLSKDMFVKNNKAAFQHVTYFLLTVLNPEIVKDKVPSWPPYEPRVETQFRNEVMKYINELNILYEDANIPVLMTSHLISPGGYKFARFMLKLSQLVLFVHLQRDPTIKQDILYSLKPNKNSEATLNSINRLRYKHKKINNEVSDIKLDYDNFVLQSLSTAATIGEQKTFISKSLVNIKQSSPDANVSTASIKSFDLLMPQIDSKLKQVKVIFQKCMKIRELAPCHDVVLDCNNSHVKIIREIHSSDRNNENLDLITFFENLSAFLNATHLKRPSFSTTLLKNKSDTYVAFNQNLQVVNKRYDNISEKIKKLSCMLDNNFIKTHEHFSNKIDPSDDTEVLAIPLENSF